MATEGMNITEEAEMAECDGDKVVTMMDVLQEQQEFEDDANAVLGASDDKNCTYVKGYIKRQAIYACLTCCPDVKTDPTKRAGVCLACSLNCHENHELVELYTKRNFRCDCGNPKFTSNPCQFTPNKTDLNTENIYNQNFSGLYCTCQRPYPDPDGTLEDDMIQCIICEDWLHASHLDAVVPANDQYSEMICKACMNKNNFLHDYSNLAVNVEIVDIVTVNVEEKMFILNGDVDMTDEKDNKTTKNESGARDGEGTVPQDKTKPSEEEEIKATDIPLQGKTQTDGNMDTVSKNQDPGSTETKETSPDPSKDDLLLKEVHKENEIASDATADNKMEGINESSDTANEQIKTDEQLSSNINIDNVNTDKNQTEVVNIKTSTSDNCLEKSSTVKEKTNDDVEKSSDYSKKVEDSINPDTSNIKSETSSSEQTKDSFEAKTGLKSENVKVSDTSQEAFTKENADDKTDAVMDAIDALLESDTAAKDSEFKETRDDLQANEVTQGTENVEMNDGSSQNELSDKENKINNKILVDSDLNESVNVESTETIPSENKTTNETPIVNGDVSQALNETNNTNKVDSDESKHVEGSTNENKRKLSITGDVSPKRVKLDASKCERPKGVKKAYKGATFWPSNFRQQLCTCGECISMYKNLNVLFLTDLEDTVSYYESLGKANIDGIASQYEKGLQALSSLDRIQQINALTEYNKMRDKLLDFLKSFKDRKEIVKEEDIKAFFAGMKPRREPDGVYFCR